MIKPLGVCLVGYGYWSPKLIRNIRVLGEFRLIAVCEKDLARHETIRKEQSDIEVLQHYRDAFVRADIDVVVIATIPSSHYRIAKGALEAGKHVLVEKPLTMSVKEGAVLLNIAKEKNLTLMVDHTYLYAPPIPALKELIDSGTLGSIYTIESFRTNLGLFQRDTNVVWDLAPHDFSILLYLIEERPYAVRAIGTKTVVHRSQKHAQESTAHIVLSYKSGLAVHIHVSWTSPVKTRQLTVVGSERMALYNQMAPHQLLLLDQGVYPNETEGDTGPLFNYKIGETTEVPYDSTGEDLLRMLKDFGQSVITGNEPRSHARLALQTVALLEATERSIKNEGTSVVIEYGKKSLVGSLLSFNKK